MISDKKLMEVGDSILEDSKANLMIDKCVAPVLVVLRGEGEDVDTIDLPAADDADMVCADRILQETSQDPSVDAMIYLTEAYIAPLEDDEPAPEALADDPRSVQVIHLAVYKREGTLIRQVMFEKSDEGEVCYKDLGWQDASDGNGLMFNPWTAQKNNY